MEKIKTIGSKGNEAIRSEKKEIDIVGEGKWTAQQLQTPTADKPLEDDTGTGKKMVVRRFDYNMPPFRPQEVRPTQKAILEYHLPKIREFLWKDGLEIAGDVKLLMSKDNKKFHIFAPAVPRLGQSIDEKAFSLGEILHKKK